MATETAAYECQRRRPGSSETVTLFADFDKARTSWIARYILRPLRLCRGRPVELLRCHVAVRGAGASSALQLRILQCLRHSLAKDVMNAYLSK